MPLTLAQKANMKFGSFKNFRVLDAAANTLLCFGHGLSTGDAVVLATQSLDPPAPLSVANTYYAIAVDLDVFKLATTPQNAIAGTAIDITDDGTGLHGITKDVATFDKKVAAAILDKANEYFAGTLVLATVNAAYVGGDINETYLKEWAKRAKENPTSMAERMMDQVIAYSKISDNPQRGIYSLDADIAEAVQNSIKTIAKVVNP